ncbi:MAG: hypothetical protein H6688_01745 [Erysipelotrichaceae bacterium]|nr:hypothetical protein [Erysipelotrichaceae bacterium]
MKSLFNVTNKHLKTFFTVLFFGGIWGFIEATLGTLLHLPFLDNAGMYAASTTVMLPIAYYLMGMCYKQNRNLRSVAYMGLIAGAIKLSLVIFLGFQQSIYMPAIYIVIESLAMMGAIAITRPTKILSPKSLLTVGIASTSYLFVFLCIKQWQGTPIFTDYTTWVNKGEFYLFKENCVMLMYTAISGGIAYGILRLSQVYHWHFDQEKWQKRLFNPLTAFSVAIIAIATTIILEVLI